MSNVQMQLVKIDTKTNGSFYLKCQVPNTDDWDKIDDAVEDWVSKNMDLCNVTQIQSVEKTDLTDTICLRFNADESHNAFEVYIPDSLKIENQEEWINEHFLVADFV